MLGDGGHDLRNKVLMHVRLHLQSKERTFDGGHGLVTTKYLCNARWALVYREGMYKGHLRMHGLIMQA